MCKNEVQPPYKAKSVLEEIAFTSSRFKKEHLLNTWISRFKMSARHFKRFCASQELKTSQSCRLDFLQRLKEKKKYSPCQGEPKCNPCSSQEGWMVRLMFSSALHHRDTLFECYLENNFVENNQSNNWVVIIDSEVNCVLACI